MGKCDSYIIQMILFLRLFHYLLLCIFIVFTEFIMLHQRCLKHDSTTVDSNGDEDEMDCLSESSGDEADGYQ